MPTATRVLSAASPLASLRRQPVPSAPPCPASPPPFSSTVFLPPYLVHRRRSASVPACSMVATGRMLLPATFPDHRCPPPPGPRPHHHCPILLLVSISAPSLPVFSSPPPVKVLPLAGALSSCIPSSLPSGSADPHPWPSPSPPASLCQTQNYPNLDYFEPLRAAPQANSLRRDHLLLASPSLPDLPPPFFQLS